MSLQGRDYKSYSAINRNRDSSLKHHYLNQPSNYSNMNKSNVTMHSDHLWHSIQEMQLFPIQLSELLRSQNHNVNAFKMRIEKEKNRVSFDIDSYKKEIVHHFEDFKLSLMTQLDNIYKMYMERYTKFKGQILQVKRLREEIQIQISARPIHTDLSHKKLATSNVKTIKAFENGLSDMKKYHIVNYITQLQKQKITPLSRQARKLIVLTQYENGYYLPKELEILLNNIKDQFKHNLRHLYECKTYIRDPEELLKKVGEDETLLQQCHLKEDLINKQGFYTNKNRQVDIDQQIQREKELKQRQSQKHQIKQKQKLIRQRELRERERQLRELQIKERELQERQRLLLQRQKQRERQLSFEKSRSRQRQLKIQKTYRNYDKQQQNLQAISPSQQIGIYNFLEDFNVQQMSSLQVNAKDIILCALIVKNQYIAIGSKDGSISIYDLVDGTQKGVLTGHRSSICSLAYVRSDDGQYLASGSDHGCCVILIWDLRNWSLKRKLQGHKAAITAIIDLKDGHHLLSGSYDKKINVYDLYDGTLEFNLPANKSSVTGMVLNSTSTKMVSCNLDNSLNVWSIVRSKSNNIVQTLYLQRIIQNGTMICSMVGSLVHQQIIYIGTKDGKIKIIDINRGQSRKNQVACNNAIIQMIVIQRENHPYEPIVIIWPCKEQSMKIVNIENNYIKSVPVKGYIEFGCGIGPKALLTKKGQIAMLSQSQFWKDITFYKILQSPNYG